MNIDDILNELNDSPLPSFDQLKELQKTLGNRIQRSIIEDMMIARTERQLSEIRRSNEVWFEEWPILSSHYDKALNRIKNVFKAYIDIMGLEMLN